MHSPADITVSHFSTFPHGGAAKAAQRLHVSLNRFGLNSQFIYHRDEEHEESAQIENMHQLLLISGLTFKTPKASRLIG